MKADILFNDNRWKKLPFEKIVHNSINLVAEDILLTTNDYEIAILACNDLEIINLNKNFRGDSAPTNILSWPEHEYKRMKPGGFPTRIVNPTKFSKGSDFLGNLAISFDRCSSEASAGSIRFEDYTTHLIIHGFLHLIGFDHDNELDAILMEDTEKRLLSRLGIKNPYELKDR